MILKVPSSFFSLLCSHFAFYSLLWLEFQLMLFWALRTHLGSKVCPLTAVMTEIGSLGSWGSIPGADLRKSAAYPARASLYS